MLDFCMFNLWRPPWFICSVYLLRWNVISGELANYYRTSEKRIKYKLSKNIWLVLVILFIHTFWLPFAALCYFLVRRRNHLVSCFQIGLCMSFAFISRGLRITRNLPICNKSFMCMRNEWVKWSIFISAFRKEKDLKVPEVWEELFCVNNASAWYWTNWALDHMITCNLTPVPSCSCGSVFFAWYQPPRPPPQKRN